jgi:hypothetical protein
MRITLLITIMLFYFNSRANNTNPVPLKINKVDHFSGYIHRLTKVYYVGKIGNSIRSQFSRYGDKYYIYLSTNNYSIGCSGASQNYVQFLFDDNSVFTYNNDLSNIDCGDRPYSKFEINIEIFQSKKLKAIRLRQSESSQDTEWIYPHTLFFLRTNSIEDIISTLKA